MPLFLGFHEGQWSRTVYVCVSNFTLCTTEPLRPRTNGKSTTQDIRRPDTVDAVKALRSYTRRTAFKRALGNRGGELTDCYRRGADRRGKRFIHSFHSNNFFRAFRFNIYYYFGMELDG